MSRTPEGRRLTDAYRQASNARAEVIRRRVSRHWGWYMRPDDIDYGRSQFAAAAAGDVLAGAEVERTMTGRYLTRHAAAEGHKGIEVVSPTLATADVAETLTINGPVAYKTAKLRGLDDATAYAYARTRVSMAARGLIMDAGRGMVTMTARANGARWRRVTDGTPCAFCAMLAGRGPVYAEDTVDFEAHSQCGCTAEECWETPDEWVAEYATEKEAAWINAYFDAAEEASNAGQPRVAPVRKAGRSRDTVLARMRRMHPDLFHDGVYPRN